MKLGVLHVAAFPFPGPHGGPLYAARVCRGLAARGHRVAIVTGPNGVGHAPIGVDVIRAPHLPGAPGVTGSGPHWTRLPNAIGIVRAIRRQLRLRAIDVVHAHHAEAALLARTAIGDHRVPIVLDWHASLADELPQWFPRAPGAGLAGRVLDRAALRAADAVLAISTHGEAHLRRLGAKTVACIPPGLDPADLAGADPARARAKWSLIGDWVLYAGNTDPYQDLDLLFAAMAAVPSAGLLVLTIDPVAPLHAMADRAGLAVDRRRFVQTSAFADVRDGIAASAVAAIPRVRCAGFPVKLLNPLGLGVPTVVSAGSWSDIPGAIPVPDGDVAGMAATIAGLIADPERRRRLGDAARTAIAADWTVDRRAAEIERFYGDVIAASNNRG